MLDKTEATALASLELEFYLTTEWDEFWSFVQTKANQRWTWYALERGSGLILAFHQGRRKDEALEASSPSAHQDLSYG